MSSPIRLNINFEQSHRRWGEWLHRKLETFYLAKAPAGRPMLHGQVLKPVFRDRVRFGAASSLRKKTREALVASRNLIVICSPAAAASTHVAAEIDEYMRLGRADRVFALVVEGKPPNECFPKALGVVVNALGAPTGERHEPIAADARRVGDGPDNALAKLISGLLDIPLDTVWDWEQRVERQRRRRTLVYVAGASLLAVTAVGFGIAARKERDKNEKLVVTLLDRAQHLMLRTTEETQQYGVPDASTEKYLREIKETLQKVEDVVGRRADLQLRGALLSLDVSRIHGAIGNSERQLHEAEVGFTAMKRLYDGALDDPRSLAVMSVRRWRSFAGYEPGSPGVIEGWLMALLPSSGTEALRLPANLKLAYLRRGEALRANGRRDAAQDDFLAGLAISLTGAERGPQSEVDHILDARLLVGIAGVAYVRREFAQALERIEDAVGRLEKLEGGVATAEGYEFVADAYLLAADTSRALTAHLHRRAAESFHFNSAVELVKKGLQYAEALEGKHPANVRFAQMVAKGHMMHGDIRLQRKEHVAAFDAYQTSRKIRDRLHNRDPNNIQVKFELGWSIMKLGEVKRESATLDLAGSVMLYEQAAVIFRDLYESRRFSAARKSLWLTLWGMERPLDDLGHSERLVLIMKEKVDVARKGLGRRSSLDAIENYVMSLADFGERLVKIGRLSDAEESLRVVLASTRAMPGAAPFPPDVLKHRVRALAQLGEISRKQGDGGRSSEWLGEARAIVNRLVEERANDSDIIKLQAEVLFQASQTHEKAGRIMEARESCRGAIRSMERAVRPSFAPNSWRKRLREVTEGCDTLDKPPVH